MIGRALAGLVAVAVSAHAAEPPARETVLAAMRQATAFMMDSVSHEGGFVWSYLPDRSRRWGELEARPSMIWIQPPGTGSVGHLLLDAWSATGDARYYDAAERVASALVRAQHPSGGWNYLHDFAGDASLREWYATVGRNAWRLEEFQRYEGNATFDDGGTAEATKFLLRLYDVGRDARHRPAVDRALAFFLDSQHHSGAWPQRWPPAAVPSHGGADYTRFLTFNDNVAAENIDTLLLAHRVLGEERLRDAARKAMMAYLATLGPAPQAGWAMQYTPDLEPAAARTFEPKALATHATARNVDQLLVFYKETGDPRFLARVPEVLAWLESCRLPPERWVDGRAFPTFLELGTNKPLYLHRTGSNAANGRYFANHDPAHTVGHYSSFREIDLDGLRRRYEEAKAAPAPAPATAETGLARFYTLKERSTSDRNDVEDPNAPSLNTRAADLLKALEPSGWWPTPLRMTSHPYRGPARQVAAAGDFGGTFVGDETDTSPFRDPAPVTGISTIGYIRNMGVLIRWLEEHPAAPPPAAAATPTP